MGTDYRYTLQKSDYDFCLVLAKIGNINILSSQVVFSLASEYSGSCGVQFIDKNRTDGAKGIQLPENWRIEWAGYNPERKQMQINFLILTN